MKEHESFGHKLFVRLRSIYHALPFSFEVKKKLKGVVYTLFGPFFRKNRPYTAWRARKSDRRLAKTLKQAFPELPKADGKWEWADYSTLSKQIQEKASLPTLKSNSDDVRLIAFYLPQFYPTPYNDKWWGKGFTEWTNVTKAKPNFVGHYQPRQPADLGFYDLRIPEVMEEQAKLAKQYGINGFCFYYYWFNGKRILERPVDAMLKNQSISMPFCLCWANEDWRGRWDGLHEEVLLEQNHSDEDDKRVINDLITYFKSPHYIRIDGKPLLMIYKISQFPDFIRTAGIWRDTCRAQGIGEIYLAMVESYENSHPERFGCEASVEFPPHKLNSDPKIPSGKLFNPHFEGYIFDYKKSAVSFAAMPHPGYLRFPGVMTSWDNTARRQNKGICFENSTPGAFQAWLEAAIKKAKHQASGDERLVFINAWNEWAESAYLEPDKRFGHTYLEAVKKAREAGDKS